MVGKDNYCQYTNAQPTTLLIIHFFIKHMKVKQSESWQKVVKGQSKTTCMLCGNGTLVFNHNVNETKMLLNVI